MKADLIYITITFEGTDKTLDYPKNLPLPRIGENIVYDSTLNRISLSGKVVDVIHVITDSVREIRIVVNKN
jgi:hypothetical protein